MASEDLTLSELVRGVPLSVVFAEGEHIEELLTQQRDSVPLEPPFHMSDQDAYLLLPSDIGIEIIDIFADHDEELLLESFRDGAVVIGTLEAAVPDEDADLDEMDPEQMDDGPPMELAVERSVRIQDLLAQGLEHAEHVLVGGGDDPVETLNALPVAQVTVGSQMVDDDSFEKMLRREMFLGRSWRLGPFADGQADPTYAYTRRLRDGRVSIEAVLFQEYEELVMLLRPAVLAPAI